MRQSRFVLTVLSLACAAGECGAQPAPPISEALRTGAVRFFADERARDSAAPSFVLERPSPRWDAAPPGYRIAPVFSRVDGKPSVRIAIEPGTSLYGTGPVPGPLLRNGTRVVCWNGTGADASNAQPWVLAVRADGTAFGAFADTSWRCEVDLTDGIAFTADGPPEGSFAVITIEGDDPDGVLAGLQHLAWRIPMPPRWALGYHQSGETYTTEARVRQVAGEFRARGIPLDAIWIGGSLKSADGGLKYEDAGIANRAGLNADLHAMGIHALWQVEPLVRLASPATAGADGRWVSNPDGTPWQVSAGDQRLAIPDLTRREVREAWSGLCKGLALAGADGAWSVRAASPVPTGPGGGPGSLPLDALHHGDPDLGGPGPHVRYHNVLGMLAAQGELDGLQAADAARRPFIVTSAGSLGSHRIAATLGTKPEPTFAGLASVVPTALNLGLSGQVLGGCSVGGAPGSIDGTLYARWFGVASLMPLAWSHSGPEGEAREPWAFGPEVERTCTIALTRRHMLARYLYTLAFDGFMSGAPIVRPVFFADPRDPDLRAEDHAYLLGANLLVVPKPSPGASTPVTMPKNLWRPLSLDDAESPDLPDLYIRGGSMIPASPKGLGVGHEDSDELDLVFCLDENGRAEGEVFDDDGDGYGLYDNKCRLARYEAVLEGGRITVSMTRLDGGVGMANRALGVRVITGGGEYTGRARDGQVVWIDVK